jgi:hypothetical protein
MAGEKETFTASVTYNTEDLYGKVEASWKITVEPGKGATPGTMGLPALLRALQGRPPVEAQKAQKAEKAPAKEAEKAPEKKAAE